MKLDTAAKTFEIVSGIAVLITLILLVVEVRENTTAQQRSSYNRFSDNLIEWRKTVVSNPELFGAWYREVMTDEDLEGEEFKRFTMHMEIMWLTYDQAYYSHSSGLLGDSEWDRFRYWVCESDTPSRFCRQVWVSLSQPFREYVEQCRPEWKAVRIKP